jgi:uracil-DNA glycosylase
MERKIDLPTDWLELLKDLFDQPHMTSLREFLIAEKKRGAIIYPEFKNIFRAFHLTPLHSLKVVILGQDPYHGPNQAHGLCFSVPEGVPHPPSLKNIFKELSQDIGCSPPKSGDLSKWARSGVLLLNSVLTVEAHKPGSHQGKGWELFTDKVIKRISLFKEHVVFVLWGAYAIKKTPLIDNQKHLVLQAAHPSPLSAHRGFFGSKPFSKINSYLIENKLEPIPWQTLC